LIWFIRLYVEEQYDGAIFMPKRCPQKGVFFLEAFLFPFGGRAGMVPPLKESEDGDRASFSCWEKRSVISNHFSELYKNHGKRESSFFLSLLLQK